MLRLCRNVSVGLLLLVIPAASAQKITISVLATTDLHGYIYPVDYYTGLPAARGLAKIATLVREARSQSPNDLLIDCGDTIQGTPLEYVYQTYVRTGRLPEHLSFEGEPFHHDPMMRAMNRLGYAAMVVGNHEFNYGLKNLERARDDAHFPWISANIAVAAGGREKSFAPYLVKTVGGVKIAVIGITTPAVPTWERPENIGAYRFLPAAQAAERAVAALRAQHPDITLLAVHAGLDRDPKTGVLRHGTTPNENVVYDLATQVNGIDAIVFGHTHQQVAELRIGNVLLVQPKNWGISLARIDFELERTSGDHWRVVRKHSRLIPVTPETPADAEILHVAKPYHEMAERYLNTPVANSAKELTGHLGRVEDTPVVDAIQNVQLYYSKADVSFTSLFNPRVTIPKGPVTVRQIAALYLYDNEMYAIEGTGRMVKDALENSARYFVSCHGETCLQAPLTNPRVMGFNYDMAEGVRYEIDLTRPPGDRIRNLTWKGRPLLPDQKLRIAVNNYRAAGSAGYSMFTGARILWKSSSDIRDLMIQYYAQEKELPVRADGNWRIIPEQAFRTLKQQASEQAKRAMMR